MYWKIFGGILLAVVWLILGIALIFSVVGFKYGVSFLRLSYLTYKPFNKVVAINVERYPISNLLWYFTIGFWLGLFCVFNMLLNGITLIALPIAKQWLKLVKVCFFPIGVKFK
ncbi:MAG: YccF domain-containing protein [Clostridia bacterium]